MATTTPNLGLTYLEVGASAVPVMNDNLDILDAIAAPAASSAKAACRVATTAALTVTYANGTAGVGATLTNAGAQAALVLDDITMAVGDRVLVKDQAAPAQNGIYTVTTVGSGASNWVMTRATDFDMGAEIVRGAYTFIVDGTVNARTIWIETGSGPWTMGTTAITFTQFFANMLITGSVTISGDISPAQITSNTDDYAPTGIGTATVLRITTDASRDLTGITTGSDGRVLLLLNVGSFPLVLKDDATSTAANRFQLNGDITVNPEEGVVLWYDATSSRWRVPLTIPSASLTTPGKVELATAAETTTGTDATRAVTPDGLAGSIFGTAVVSVLIGDPLGSQVTTGDGKAYFRVPSTLNGMNLIGVAASVSTVSSSGLPTYQLRRVRAGTPADMLSTKVSIDVSETDSSTATAAAVIDTANDDVATGDKIFFDKDVAGVGELGDAIEMQFQLP